ncbi:MAG: aerobic-type carbon monoxide dehydrogenase, large subunit CoxL/CutL-like protein [Nocardioides sp.]|nr:aerobic-type carbon monoxide dehydrogenase, large subunit CoxL/CutL-like protein [Nocardioides sp.]
MTAQKLPRDWTSHAWERAIGNIRYTDDDVPRGMTYAVLVRATIAHGQITSVERDLAREVPGVLGVFTFEDLMTVARDGYHGTGYRDQPMICDGIVRHYGEPVIVVVATNQRIAEYAAGLVSVNYAQLPVVLGDREALANPEALHRDVEPSADFIDLKGLKPLANNPNIYVRSILRTGDFDEVAKSAPHVFEHQFSTASASAAPLETVSSYAVPNRDGSVEMLTQTQMPSYVRVQLARMFGMTESRIRVRHAPLGGGFGFKIYARTEPIVMACALLVGRPVGIKFSMEEQFYLPHRRGTTTTISSAVDEDGKILARRCFIIWNGGAYADVGPRMVKKGGNVAAGPYEIPVVDIESVGVYSNRIPGGAIRGFGIPQIVWAYETHGDMIADSLGIDPVTFRRRNLMKRNAVHHTGTPLGPCDPRLVFERLIEELQSRPLVEPDDPELKAGRGLAIALKAVMGPTTSTVKIMLNPDGSATVHCGTVEMGQGSNIAMAQMVADELNLSLDEVKVVSGDTDSVPWDMGTAGSRSTNHMHKAIAQAAEDLRAQLRSLSAAMDTESQIGDDVDPFKVKGGVIEYLRAGFGPMGATLTGVGAFTPDYIPPDSNGQSERITEFWMCAATSVDVIVDPLTGVVRLDQLLTISDVGKAINPEIVRTQLSGASIMMASISLSEEIKYDEDGQVLNPGLALYRIFGFEDSPNTVYADMVRDEGDEVPRGVGESGTFGVAPAIASAIHDAVGVWMTDLPIKPENVLKAIEEATDE